jgi:hypothetical protein
LLTQVSIVGLVLCIPSYAASPNRVDGSCGRANGLPSGVVPTADLCAAGTPSRVISSGSSWSWTCSGSHGGTTASCSAPITPPPPPVLTLTVTPMAPAIAQTTPLGTPVAMLAPRWSDGSPFTGVLQFSGPYYDDGGTFAISGNQLIISPAGRGVFGDGGTIQKVTVEATQ